MNTLQKIYERLWEIERYRKVSPAAVELKSFLKVANPTHQDSILDIGCGTGRASEMLYQRGFKDIVMLDFASNCLDDSVKSLDLKFIPHDITAQFPVQAKYGMCVDVMEHLEEKDVGVVLDNMKEATEYLFLRICTVPDNMGKLIGKQLHLTIRPFEWWDDIIRSKFRIIYSYQNEKTALFYVSK